VPGALGPAARLELAELRVLVIDNYDSFTFNLVQLVASLCGRVPEVVRNDALSLAQVSARAPDAVLLSPGPGSPAVAGDVGVCPELVLGLDAPILGVCLGHQVLAQALGGRVVPAPRPMHGRVSLVEHGGAGLFAGLPRPLAVVRYHSLIVEEGSLPPLLRPSAWIDEDGRRLVMALAHAERPLFGVQFHPESILSAAGAQLVGNFLALAASRRRPAPRPSPPAPALPPRPASAHDRAPPPPRARTLRREVPWLDPERAFAALGPAGSAFWLDGDERYAYLGEAREQVTVRGRLIEQRGPRGVSVQHGDPFAVLDGLCAARRTTPDPEWPFCAGYVGWLGYELKQFCEGGEGPRHDGEGGPPDALLLLAERVLCLDRQRRRACLIALVHEGQDEAAACAWLDEQAARLAAAPPVEEPAPPAPRGPPLRFQLDADRPAYLASVARIQALLEAGETYEICLTTQARARLTPAALDPLLLHRLLRRSNPAPYSAFLRFPGGAVVSASPERFVHVDRGGRVQSRPIKGTRRRGATALEDAALCAELRGSEKDRAENLMIVDLVRHDLGRVCVVGSVEVPALMHVETHPTVLHLSSTVEGQLRPGVSPLAAVRALFPGGSMTGAPKIRAMRIIGELEGRPRGVYSGAIGALGFDGALDLAMAIRTVVVDGDAVSLGVGGAVVALSRAADEFEEVRLKGRALAGAIARACGRPLAADDVFADG